MLKFFDMEPRIFPNQPMWWAEEGSFTFIITEEPDGFMASVKVKGATPFDGTRKDLGYFGSINEARAACDRFIEKKQ